MIQVFLNILIAILSLLSQGLRLINLYIFFLSFLRSLSFSSKYTLLFLCLSLIKLLSSHSISLSRNYGIIFSSFLPIFFILSSLLSNVFPFPNLSACLSVYLSASFSSFSPSPLCIPILNLSWSPGLCLILNRKTLSNRASDMRAISRA